MELEYGIKNFRVFDKSGAVFHLKPITLLTGANCAGKSSLVKSMLLLKQFLDNSRAGSIIDPISSSISFLDESINIKGIDSVINNKSGGYKDVVFTYSHTPITPLVSIGAELTFSSRRHDYFNNGWLKEFRCFCTINGDTEDFLDIVFDKDSSRIKAFNISGNLYRAFIHELEMATALNLMVWDDTDPDDLSGKDLEYWTICSESIHNNELNKAYPFYSQVDRKAFINDLVQYYKRHYHLFELFLRFPLKDLSSIEQSGSLLYLPILEKIGCLAPEQLAFYFEKRFYLPKDLENRRPLYQALFDVIVKDYSKSGFSNFIDYYREKERLALSDIAVGQTVCTHSFSGENDGYLSQLKSAFYDCYEARSPFYDYSIKTDKGLIRRIKNSGFQVDIGIIYLTLSCGIPVLPLDNASHTLRTSFQSHVTKAYTVYRDYVFTIIDSLFKMKDFRHVEYVESFLCPVQRSYSIYDKSNRMSMLLLSYLAVAEQYKPLQKEDAFKVDFVERWIQYLGIGSSFRITQDKGATNIMLSVMDAFSKRVSIADLGQGVSQLLFLLLFIEKNIMEFNLMKYDKSYCGPRYRTICVVEPEIGLHPSWQSTLAQIFEDAYKHSIHFIVETHSEYLIRATQAIVAKTVKNEEELKDIPFIVYYMEKGGKAYDMEYQVSGRLYLIGIFSANAFTFDSLLNSTLKDKIDLVSA